VQKGTTAKASKKKAEAKTLNLDDLTPEQQASLEGFLRKWDKFFEPERRAIDASRRRGDGPSPYMNVRCSDR
jgi:hypothetical protein